MGTPCTNCIDATKLGCGPTTSDNVTYTGPNLPCSTINTKDTLTIAFQKIDALLCNVPGGQDLQQTLINGNVSTDNPALFGTAANTNLTTISFNGVKVEDSTKYVSYSKEGILFSLNNTIIKPASPGAGLVNLLVPTLAPGTYTIATVNQIPNDSNLLHKTGDEIKTGDLTVNAIIKAGGDDSEYLMADGSTSTINGIVTSILTPNILDGDTTHAPTGDAVYDALQAIIATIPDNFAQIVYVNSNNPTTATIFDLNNPPVTNDNALKNDVDNLYIGTDASTWVYQTSPAGYVTYIATSTTSNFYITGTNTDAGGIKTGSITKRGELVIDSQTVGLSGFKLLQIPDKVLVTNSAGLVVGATFLQDVQYALDNNVIHRAGTLNEGFTGIKSAINSGSGGQLHGFSLGNTSSTSSVLTVNNTGTYFGAFFTNTSTGTALVASAGNSGTAIIASGSSSATILNTSNSGSGNVFLANSSGTGHNVVSNQTGTGFNFIGQNAGVNTYTVDKFGNGIFAGNVTGATPISANHLTTKAYVDALVVGLLDLRGSYDASTNVFPSTGGSGTAGAILKGDLWYVSVAGTLGGQNVPIGSSFFALADAPGQTASNWALLSANLGYVPADDANVIHKTLNETKTGTLTVNSIIRAGGLATQFLKADGSIDSTAYATTLHAATHISGGSDPIAGQSLDVTLTPSPLYYSPINATLQGHLLGIDQTLGTINQTTAGISTRVYFTGDNTTVTAGTFFTSNASGKGSTAAGTPQQTVVNGDNVKQYFAKDIISVPIAAASIGIPGAYSGQLTVSSTPTPGGTQQRFTIEVYKTNNGGTPIASGVTGAPVGDLGVTVVAILDSGIINIVAGSITNVNLTGNLVSQLTLNVGERLRYHVSAAKVGTGGGNVTMNVYYGTNYNSYYDVPVVLTTDVVLNKSLIAGITTSDALNSLNTNKANDSDVIHKTLNETKNGSLTIIVPSGTTGLQSTSISGFGVYGASTSGTGVYGTSSSGVGLRGLSATSVGLQAATTSGLRIAEFEANSTVRSYINNVGGYVITGGLATQYLMADGTTSTLTNPITGTGTVNKLSKWTSSTVQGDSMYIDNGLDTGINTTALYTLGAGWSFLNINNTTGSGYVTQVNNIGALRTSSSSLGSGFTELRNAYLSFGTNGTEVGRFLANGNFGVGSTAPIGKLDIFTGLSGFTTDMNAIPPGTIGFGNDNVTNTAPTIFSKSVNDIAMSLIAGASDINTSPDMRFNVRRSNNTDFTTLTTPAFSFTRFNTALVTILRNGNTGFGITNPGSPVDVFGAQNSRLVNTASNLIPDSGVTMSQGIALAQVAVGGGAGYAVAGYQVNSTSSLGILSQVALNADAGVMPLITLQGNQLSNVGASATFVATRPILGVNNYTTRLITVLANGLTGIGTPTPNFDLHIHRASTTSAIQFTNNTTGTTTLDGFLISLATDGSVNLINRENTTLRVYTNNIVSSQFNASGGMSIGNTVDPGTGSLNVSDYVGSPNTGVSGGNKAFQISGIPSVSTGPFGAGIDFRVWRFNGTIYTFESGMVLDSARNLTVTGSIFTTTGTVRAASFALQALNTAPATSTAAGTLGEIRYDANYMYVCVATNTWKRSPLTTW